MMKISHNKGEEEMKKITVILHVLLILLLCSCTSSILNTNQNLSKFEEENFGKRFTPAELQADLNFLVKTSLSVHPSFYSAVDSLTFQKELLKIRSNLKEPATRIEFYKRIAPLLAMLNNGHTGIIAPAEEWNSYLNNGGRYLPFRISYENSNGVVVKKNLDSNSTIKEGAKIIRINNLSADSLFNVIKKNYGGERDVWRNMMAENSFNQSLWLYGVKPPYRLIYSSANSKNEFNFETEGKISDQTKNQNQANRTRYKRYTFNMLPDKIGYINYTSMGNDPENPFEEFLAKSFTELKSKSAKGLIVDLRKNGGGNSMYGDLLLDYVTDKPYKDAAKKVWKMSPEYKSYWRGRITWWLRWLSYPPAVWLARIFFDEAKIFTADDGESIVYDFPETTPGNNPLRFNGKVCFLIGTDTYSSAVMLSNAAGDYKLAELIGEETGGIPNEFGDLYQFSLPVTCIQVYLPTAQFVRANGDATDRRGVLPDIEVKQKPEDTKLGIDTGLETARLWILK